MNKIVLSLMLFTVLLFNSCKDSGVGPKPEDKPGRRDYVWTVDTLNHPGNILYRIWGSSPTDVWVISDGADLYNMVFHFNGNRWTTDGKMNPFIPSSIFGFGSGNVIIGSADGKLYRYNGNSWIEIASFSKNGNVQIVFDNIWGESSNNFYAFGAYTNSKGMTNNAFIVNFSNGEWKVLNTDNLQGQGIVENLYQDIIKREIYFRTNKWGDFNNNSVDSTVIFRFNEGKFQNIFSSKDVKGYSADISLINGEVYFVLGSIIAKRVNDQFQTMIKVDNPNFYQRIWGRNSKDIFLFMTDGLVHYNGNDFEYLFHLDKPQTYILGASVFNNEVFFIVYESQIHLNLIYHGKLKE